ncbi:hypothetical protein [Modestobacter excelsi]|uniref:hypothetical protein n=1 Tax=Modestobacter excelsi TaxID=2213161 RepID=UPI00110CCEE6|nr:hypothetical protein [Modestobacter excelsi]
MLVVAAIAAALVLASSDGSSTAVADQPMAATAPTPTTTPAPTVTVTATATATASDVPGTFVDAMQQLGIPLDANTGWAVAQGICVRLGHPARYDEFTMAEGIERLFPSVHDEQAHAFVDMVVTSVCHL